jgi:hypothetical protein
MGRLLPGRGAVQGGAGKISRSKEAGDSIWGFMEGMDCRSDRACGKCVWGRFEGERVALRGFSVDFMEGCGEPQRVKLGR